jgi:hypothetical protein
MMSLSVIAQEREMQLSERAGRYRIISMFLAGWEKASAVF